MTFRWPWDSWNADPEEVQIPPGTPLPVDITASLRREMKVAAAIQYLGTKYCLYRPYKKPQ